MKRSPENPLPDNGKDNRSAEVADKDEGGFVGRWSRRKQSVAADSQKTRLDDQLSNPLSRPVGDGALPEVSGADEVIHEESQPAPILTDADMPDIETLNADSDFSPFFSEGVSKALRNLALKKLFFSGKFAARDGLDDYDDDFTRFEPLGDTVTSDMKFHARRKEKARLAELEEERLRLEAEAENNRVPEEEVESVAETDASESDIAASGQPETRTPSEETGNELIDHHVEAESPDSKSTDKFADNADLLDKEPQKV